jgi:hypothetical protein
MAVDEFYKLYCVHFKVNDHFSDGHEPLPLSFQFNMQGNGLELEQRLQT